MTEEIDLECNSRDPGDGEHEVVKRDWARERHGEECEYAAEPYGDLGHEAGQAGTCETDLRCLVGSKHGARRLETCEGDAG